MRAHHTKDPAGQRGCVTHIADAAIDDDEGLLRHVFDDRTAVALAAGITAYVGLQLAAAGQALPVRQPALRRRPGCQAWSPGSIHRLATVHGANRTEADQARQRGEHASAGEQ